MAAVCLEKFFFLPKEQDPVFNLGSLIFPSRGEKFPKILSDQTYHTEVEGILSFVTIFIDTKATSVTNVTALKNGSRFQMMLLCIYTEILPKLQTPHHPILCPRSSSSPSNSSSSPCRRRDCRPHSPPPLLLLPAPSRRPRLVAIVDHHPPDVLRLEVINDRPVPSLVQRRRVVVVSIADALVVIPPPRVLLPRAAAAVPTDDDVPRAAQGPPRTTHRSSLSSSSSSSSSWSSSSLLPPQATPLSCACASPSSVSSLHPCQQSSIWGSRRGLCRGRDTSSADDGHVARGDVVV